jgi:hypothetical protein
MTKSTLYSVRVENDNSNICLKDPKRTLQFYNMKTRLLILLSVLMLVDARAHGAAIFEGVFTGTMQLNDGTARNTVDLSLTLSPTGQVESTGGDGLFEEQQVIDGAFLIDDEGGPTGFSKVRYNLERNEIDLRYNRSTVQYTPAIPSSFRLIGNIGKHGELTGKVISGLKGPIGTFRLERSSQTHLEVIPKYYGTWVGKTTRVDGSTDRTSITIEEASGSQVTNPSHMELDYTKGRLAHVRVNGIPLEFNQVVIDYLRQRIYLISLDAGGHPSMTYQAVMNSKTKELVGFSNGLFTGRNGTFRLKYVN